MDSNEPSHGRSSGNSIGDSSVIKDGGVYFLCQPDGSIPLADGHGLGLYSRDCRFLSGYEVRLDGHPLEPLMANDEDAFKALFLLTNAVEARGIRRRHIGLRWRHVADGGHHALSDELVLENYDTQTHCLELGLKFAADFRDIFVIRGLAKQHQGKLNAPTWRGSALVFSKDGGDGHTRELIIEFSETPTRRETDGVVFATPLAPHATFRVALSFTMEERESSAPPNSEGQVREQSEGTEEASERSMEAWMSGFSRVRSTALSMFKSRGTAAEEHAASAENR